MSDLLKRSFTGAILVILLYGALFAGGITFFIFFSLVNILGLWEFYELVKKPDLKPQKYLGIVSGFITLVIFYLVASEIAEIRLLFVVLPLFFLVLLIELFRKTKEPIANISLTLSGILYISVPLGMLSFLAFVPGTQGVQYDPWLIAVFFLLIMVNDTGAYLVGVPLGRHRLFERISPKKSWEGAVGGLIFTLLAVWLISEYIPEWRIADWLIIAVIVVVFGTLGDLVESMFKRSLNVKDSGNIFPAHGGILDRFDSMFVSAPFVLAYLKLFLWN